MIDALKGLTYMVRHNPNCPKAFEVRLTGAGLLATVSWLGTISRQYGRNQPIDNDDKGYGDTLEEAAENAIAAREERLERTMYAPQRARAFKKVWREERL
jgi:hypothetical protein